MMRGYVQQNKKMFGAMLCCRDFGRQAAVRKRLLFYREVSVFCGGVFCNVDNTSVIWATYFNI